MESSHRRDDGSSFCSDADIVVAGRGGGNATANVAVEDGVPPIYDIEFNCGEQSDNDPGEDETKEAKEVVAAFANAAVVEGGGHPTSPASSVSGDVQRGGVAGRIKEAGAPPRRSPSSMSNITGLGVSRQKTKKSTKRERGSISKAVERVIESIESGAGGGGIVI